MKSIFLITLFTATTLLSYSQSEISKPTKGNVPTKESVAKVIDTWLNENMGRQKGSFRYFKVSFSAEELRITTSTLDPATSMTDVYTGFDWTTLDGRVFNKYGDHLALHFFDANVTQKTYKNDQLYKEELTKIVIIGEYRDFDDIQEFIDEAFQSLKKLHEKPVKQKTKATSR